jgi:hypothetical protein
MAVSWNFSMTGFSKKIISDSKAGTHDLSAFR